MSDPAAPEPVPATRLGDRGVHTWLTALHVAGTDLPEPVRYTLCVLSLYMRPDGTQARPGYQRLTAVRGRSDRTVRTHLEQAARAGWVRCVQRGGRSGDGTVRANVYEATFPAAVYARLAEVLEAAWGNGSQPEVPGVPVEQVPQPEVPGVPVEQVPQPEVPGVPVEAPSTGSPGLPSNDHGDDGLIDRSDRSRLIVKRNTDAAEDEIAPFLGWLTTRYPLRTSLTGYLARMAERGHLQMRVDQWRTTRMPPPAPAAKQPPAGKPRPCPHGQPDGAGLTPEGLPRCPLCRKHLRTCDRDPVYCTPCQDIRQALGLPPDPRNPDRREPDPPPSNVIPLIRRASRATSPHRLPPGWEARSDRRNST